MEFDTFFFVGALVAPVGDNGGSPASVSLADTTDSAELNRSLADSGLYDDLTSPATSARVIGMFYVNTYNPLLHPHNSSQIGIPQVIKNGHLSHRALKNM